MIKRFDNPIYVTRPMLPPLHEFQNKLRYVWDSKQLTNNGPNLQLFQKKIQRILKVRNASVFNNGTMALMIAIKSLGIQGEIITTPFTFPATLHVLHWNGITPVFCDIEEKSMTIDPNRIESMITPKTSAILGVHVYGNPCNIKGIQDIADHYGLRVIYDAAHAFMTEIDSIGIGSFGDISMFSFHATKLFHTAEGGALTYNNNDLKQRIELLKNFGIKNEDEVIMPGINCKMNEIQAVLGLINLRYIEAEREKRERIIETYVQRLRDFDGISPNVIPKNIKNSYQYFVIRVDRTRLGISRDEIYTGLKEFNVFSRKYFYPLCSEYPYYQHLPSADPSNLPVSKKVVNEVLCLPLYGELPISSVERICEIIKGFTK
jgi:dTDP-4-amino-4,6-dideoxygalactose transaminase